MVVLGLLAVVVGGLVFHVFVALICGAMIWELVRMLAQDTPDIALQLAVLFGAAILIAINLPGIYAVPILAAPIVYGAARIPGEQKIFVLYATVIAFAGYGLMEVRDDIGLTWVLWLFLVVIATDVAGYFAGKGIGGPKLWPRVSPKKTWSGTIAGWVAAALVGVGFVWSHGAGPGLILLSVVVSMAAQAGDIAESAIKRKSGVKDSSGLIPGHGGLLDRFDGMLGALLVVLLLRLMGLVPGGGT